MAERRSGRLVRLLEERPWDEDTANRGSKENDGSLRLT